MYAVVSYSNGEVCGFQIYPK